MSKKPVDYSTFLNWVQNHFDNIRVTDLSIRVNSIYCDHLGGDRNKHLWCRPHTGFYHCYKSAKRGSLYELVMDVERCSYEEAVDILGGDQSLRYLEAKLETFFAKENGVIVEKLPKFELPPNTFPINKLLPKEKKIATDYLNSRMIPADGLYYCIDEKYYGRIVIPYYDSDGELVYFNSRDILHPNPFLRYKGPESETRFKKDEVVWMSFFPKKGTKIYLTEGEFDAMTLDLCGLHGCATGGKEVSEKQIQLIRDYQVCLAFDADPSGKNALRELGQKLPKNGIHKVTFVRPPTLFKDWNKMYTSLKGDEKILRAYISQNEKIFDEFTSLLFG